MPFSFERRSIPDVVRVETEVFADERGALFEAYKRPAFEDASINADFQLDLVSRSDPRILRGLHFQRSPYEQAKLVRCISGEIFDVAVDLRATSNTFGEHVSIRLTEDDNEALFVPRGFAHGFLALTDATVLYKLDNNHAPDYEGGVHWDDPRLAIEWPLESDPIVGKDDRNLPTLDALETDDDLL